MNVLTKHGRVLCQSCAVALNAHGKHSEHYADSYCDECGDPTFTPSSEHMKKCYGSQFRKGDPVYRHRNTDSVGNGEGFIDESGKFISADRLIGTALEDSGFGASMVRVKLNAQDHRAGFLQ